MRRTIFRVLTSAVLAGCTHSAPLPTPAPNATSPAPVAVERDSRGQCLMFPIRAQHARASELIDVLGSQVPTWLPDGFGLQTGWKPGDDGGSRGAIWSDDTCRLVMLEIFPGAAAEESPRPAHRWALIDRGTCTFGYVRDVSCLTYHAQTDGDAVSLQLVDLTPREASRIVDGINV